MGGCCSLFSSARSAHLEQRVALLELDILQQQQLQQQHQQLQQQEQQLHRLKTYACVRIQNLDVDTLDIRRSVGLRPWGMPSGASVAYP